MNDKVSRRDLLAGVAGAAAGVTIGAAAGAQALGEGRSGRPGQAGVPPAGAGTANAEGRPARGPLFFFNDDEARFVEAAAERLIPEDDSGPGAAYAGVLAFIDGQLASAWGAGGRMYLAGPWVPDAPATQGYQLRHAPAELYRIAIAEIAEAVDAAYGGRPFWELAPAVQDEVLTALEEGRLRLATIPGPVFFETLLANTIEGFFADPAYGGNRDMVGWRLVGFPGAFASYIDLVDQYDLAYVREPISVGNEAARQAHIHAHDRSGG